MTRLTKAEFVARIKGAIEDRYDFMPKYDPSTVYHMWYNRFEEEGYRIQYDFEKTDDKFNYIYIIHLSSSSNPPTEDQVTFVEENTYPDDYPEELCEEALHRLPYITSKWLHVKTAVEYEFYDTHYESPLGTRVTQVNVGDAFYVVGILRDKSTQEGVSGIEVLAYQTDGYGTAIQPYVYLKATTSATGSFEIGGFSAEEAGSVWFVCYDKKQAEEAGLPTT